MVGSDMRKLIFLFILFAIITQDYVLQKDAEKVVILIEVTTSHEVLCDVKTITLDQSIDIQQIPEIDQLQPGCISLRSMPTIISRDRR